MSRQAFEVEQLWWKYLTRLSLPAIRFWFNRKVIRRVSWIIKKKDGLIKRREPTRKHCKKNGHEEDSGRSLVKVSPQTTQEAVDQEDTVLLSAWKRVTSSTPKHVAENIWVNYLYWQRQIGTNQFKSVQLLASSCSRYFGGAFPWLYTCIHGARNKL